MANLSEPDGIVPARLVRDAAGVPCAPAYGDVYHAAAGGPGQSHHVFLAGTGLPARWRGRSRFTILETGFGLGLNFLVAWAAWRADARAAGRLDYVAVERHPFPPDDLRAAHAAWPDLAEPSRALLAAWPPLVAGFHRLSLDGGRVSLTLLFGDAAAMLAELDARADAIFLDGFAPARNPRMWSDAVVAEVARLAAPGAVAASWTVAGTVRARLASAGFAVEKRPGYAAKREMLVASIRGGPVTHPRPGSAVVVGAGLAGAACAARLAARGWAVEVIERHRAPAAEASGNRAGIMRPIVNISDGPNARLSRAAFLHAVGDPQAADAGVLHRGGVLHVAATAADGARLDRIAERHAFPATYLRPVDRVEAGALAGHPVSGPGWWFPSGAWADPAALCRALLAGSVRIRARYGTTAASVEHGAGGWTVRDAGRRVLAVADRVVLACAADARALAPAARLPLGRVRGQVTHLPPRPGRRLLAALSGDGYLAPLEDGGCCIGATFQHDDAATDVRIADHASNLARAARLLPGYAAGLAPGALRGRAAHRTTTPDRLPICGDLFPDVPGLAAITGLGARGLIWAPLCAEILASRLDDGAAPVERSLAATIDPLRFAARG